MRRRVLKRDTRERERLRLAYKTLIVAKLLYARIFAAPPI